MLHRTLRGWAIRYRDLERDKAAEAKEHPLWPVAGLLFCGWRKRCNHPRAAWTPDRFWIAEPFLSTGRYGKTLEVRVMLCARAIAGAEHDAFKTTRRNGTVKTYDEWERIFGCAGKLEEFCNRAPIGWTPTLSDRTREAIRVAETKISKRTERKQRPQ